MAGWFGSGQAEDTANERPSNVEMASLEGQSTQQESKQTTSSAPATQAAAAAVGGTADTSTEQELSSSPSTQARDSSGNAITSIQDPSSMSGSARNGPQLDTASAQAAAAATTTTTTTTTTSPDSPGPSLQITLLLTNGARHPWVVDRRYLRKRSVTAESDDPYNISVYTLKELIWKDWRPEWESRPSNPTYIRLISFGRMLEDKAPLKDCRFSNESPNVVHMTVRLQEIVDEEEPGKTGKGRSAEGGRRALCCGCVIM